MIRIRGLEHVVLRVSNMQQSVAFYRDVLGCAIERTSSPTWRAAPCRRASSRCARVQAYIQDPEGNAVGLKGPPV